MVRISMLSTLPPIKGMSYYTLGLVKELSKMCEIDFYGFKSIYPEFLYPGGTKTKTKEPQLNDLRIYNFLTWYNPFSWIKTGFSFKSNIVHAQWWSWFLAPAYYVSLKIAKLRGKKIILTVHNIKPHEKSFLKNFLNRSVLGLADEYIVHSENNRKLFLNEMNAKKKISTISHGIIEMKKSKVSRSFLRKKYQFSTNDRVLLFFGNIRDYKGLDILLESLSQLRDKNIKLIIAGNPWSGFEKYQNIINKLALNSRIRLLLEFNSDQKVSEIFRISDLVVYPYKEFEASSGAASVALDFGKPIVVTNVGGLPELVKDIKVVAKPENILDLNNKISYALANLNRLGKDSNDIKKKFSWAKVAEKTLEVYGR
jgi:glycosyltransferase involved in cell wall biosynthesis